MPDKASQVAADLAEQQHRFFRDTAEGLEQFDKPTLRVSPTEIRKGRRALRDAMPDPWWAKGRPKDWNAHHIIPVEQQNHRVFNALTATKEGWNHHDPLLNGLALPTNPKAAAKAGLPRHQVAGSSLVRGHPNLNRDAEALLDALDPFLDDPVRLRAEVLKVRDQLRDEIVSGARGDVLF